MMDKNIIKLLLWKKPTIEVLNEEKANKINNFRHYIGYEISGYVHLGTAVVSGYKLIDFMNFAETEVFLADWHSVINNKLGGDPEVIKRIGKGYFTEAMKQTIKSLGGDPDKIKFVLASEIYNNDYWAEVIKIGKNTTLNRLLRSVTIMGRKYEESMPSANLIYPLMQAADIIFQKINIAHAGIDQRKAHVITIEYADKINYDLIAVHHQLITNLQLPYETFQKLKSGNIKEAKEELSELKMSKSIPGSAIFVHDSPSEIIDKINKAFCPQRELEFNPIWEIVEYLIFRDQEGYGVIKYLYDNNLYKIENIEKINYDIYEELKNKNKINWNDVYKIIDKESNELYKYSYKDIEFEIINEKTGERKVYNNLWDLRKDWVEGKIHPLDLKKAVGKWLANKLEPVYKYFTEGPGKKYKEELDSVKITR
ncbi:MAG: tyrosine--tRNA ligase [Candidatus Nanopusillus sp.]|nr:tyrosine--tRNA ligase [Candidatus Nanopusillus sp.]